MNVYIDNSHRMKPTHTAKRVMGRAGAVLHSSEGYDSLDWLQGHDPDQPKPASADFLISRAGNLYQLTQPGFFSYHVGIGKWHNLNNDKGMLNELLVGIEMESHGSQTPRYTDIQLVVCAALIRKLMMQHLFPITHVTYHRDIALPPGRRSDPVNFPAWVWTRELLYPSALASSFVWPVVLP